MGELVERLRARGNRYDHGAMMHGELLNPDGPEAADRIEALEARCERVEAALTSFDAACADIDTCGDGNCVVLKPKGQHTNGFCWDCEAHDPFGDCLS